MSQQPYTCPRKNENVRPHENRHTVVWSSFIRDS